MSELLRRRAGEQEEVPSPASDRTERNATLSDVLQQVAERHEHDDEQVRESQIAQRTQEVKELNRSELLARMQGVHDLEKERVTKIKQQEWLESVGTTTNYYESRTFTYEELEAYHNIVQDFPNHISNADAPSNLLLMVQLTKWQKEYRAQTVINQLTGNKGYEEELNKILGETEDSTTSGGTVDLSFNQVLNFNFDDSE